MNIKEPNLKINIQLDSHRKDLENQNNSNQNANNTKKSATIIILFGKLVKKVNKNINTFTFRFLNFIQIKLL